MMAEFPGGEQALAQFLADSMVLYNTVLPKINRTVFVRITITESGGATDPTIIGNICECRECDEIALKITSALPRWTPAMGLYHDGAMRREKDQHILSFSF